MSGAAAALGGLLWVLLWAAYLLTHGPGPEDQRGRLFGLTHYDYGKFVVVPLALVGVALVGLHAGQRRGAGRLGSPALALALLALVAMAVGMAASLWPIPWGSYDVDWRVPRMMWGGIAASLASLGLVVGLVPYAVATLRARSWPGWIALPLALGPLALVPWLHMTPWGGAFGVAWLLVGAGLRYGPRTGDGEGATRRGRPRTPPEEPPRPRQA